MVLFPSLSLIHSVVHAMLSYEKYVPVRSPACANPIGETFVGARGDSIASDVNPFFPGAILHLSQRCLLLCEKCLCMSIWNPYNHESASGWIQQPASSTFDMTGSDDSMLLPIVSNAALDRHFNL
jgi:hypothetical protein